MAPQQAVNSEGYYGLPMLKRPLWGWEIAFYFFFEGISSGTFILAALADVCGGGRYRAMIRKSRYLAFATLLPCPPLLIADLGRPERFHHMLRIVKLSSPMSLGAWALLGFSQPVAILALAQFAGAPLDSGASAERGGPALRLFHAGVSWRFALHYQHPDLGAHPLAGCSAGKQFFGDRRQRSGRGIGARSERTMKGRKKSSKVSKALLTLRKQSHWPDMWRLPVLRLGPSCAGAIQRCSGSAHLQWELGCLP